MRAFIFRTFDRFVSRNREKHVEEVMLVCSSTGGLVGMLGGFHRSRELGDGFIWRPLAFGAVGGTVGLVAGAHYKKILAISVAIDLLRSITRISKE